MKDFIPQCQHTDEGGGRCLRCQYPMDAKLHSRMKTPLIDSVSHMKLPNSYSELVEAFISVIKYGFVRV